MNCTANGKPLCYDGVQTRYEGGTRGTVKLPCPICRPIDFAAWADEWKPEPKPEKPVVQQSMFEQKKAEEYPG